MAKYIKIVKVVYNDKEIVRSYRICLIRKKLLVMQSQEVTKKEKTKAEAIQDIFQIWLNLIKGLHQVKGLGEKDTELEDIADLLYKVMKI